MKIGIIKEGKIPPDSRVPLIPAQCKALREKYPKLEIFVESSTVRCFDDKEYEQAGIPIVNKVGDCDVLFGVKEVPIGQLIPDKTYFFFSHTIKEQPYNRNLLKAIIEKGIRLVDYECLTDEKGIRVIAFGRWAGIVGAHNALYAWGRRTGKITMKRVGEFKNYESLKESYRQLKIPALKIAITGDGRVANGAAELLNNAKIKRVSRESFLKDEFDKAVYVQLSPRDLYAHKEGKPFDLQDFFENPSNFNCDFKPFYSSTDLMINAIYWDPEAPRFFTKEEMRSPDFKIKTIADISCDINGSIPATLRASTIREPVYGYDPVTEKETAPYLPTAVDIMAVDNLPNELPRDASESFGNQLIEKVIPQLLHNGDMIKRAAIAENGKLGPGYQYLQNYLEGK